MAGSSLSFLSFALEFLRSISASYPAGMRTYHQSPTAARRVDPRFAALVGIVLRLLGVQRLRLLGREEFGKVTLYLTTESYAAGAPPAAKPLPRCSTLDSFSILDSRQNATRGGGRQHPALPHTRVWLHS